jgi:hypothetical protein
MTRGVVPKPRMIKMVTDATRVAALGIVFLAISSCVVQPGAPETGIVATGPDYAGEYDPYAYDYFGFDDPFWDGGYALGFEVAFPAADSTLAGSTVAVDFTVGTFMAGDSAAVAAAETLSLAGRSINRKRNSSGWVTPT